MEMNLLVSIYFFPQHKYDRSQNFLLLSFLKFILNFLASFLTLTAWIICFAISLKIPANEHRPLKPRSENRLPRQKVFLHLRPTRRPAERKFAGLFSANRLISSRNARRWAAPYDAPLAPGAEVAFSQHILIPRAPPRQLDWSVRVGAMGRAKLS